MRWRPSPSSGVSADLHARAFFDLPSWISHLGECDFAVGARTQSVMLARQAGMPALCIAHDSRTLEMCQLCRVYVDFLQRNSLRPVDWLVDLAACATEVEPDSRGR